MAARKRAIRHDDNTRAKIQAAQLINRLTAHAQGEVELSSTQVRAIEVLLRKTLPDLSDVRMEVDSQPITFQLDLGNKDE
jgi:predicted signal transduction protein with EAL and GGDEF domain